MKTESRQVTMYTTMYISEDGLFESKDPNKVQEYEANCKYKTFEPVLTIRNNLLDYEKLLNVYKCEDEQEYQEFITFCSIEYRSANKRDIQDARQDYEPEYKYWVPIISENSDARDTFYLEPLATILWEMEVIESELCRFHQELDDVRKLVKDEEVE